MRIGDIEAVEEIRDIEWRGDLGPKDVAGQQAIEIEPEMPRGEHHLFACGLECVAIQTRTKHGQRGGKRVPRFRRSRARPQELSEMVAIMKPPAFDGEIHQQREVLFGAEAHWVATRGEESG